MIRILIILFVLFPYVIFSEPSISSAPGPFIHGSPSTISGSGFGTKTTAAPIRFERFEIKDGGGLPTVGVDPGTEISYWTLHGGGVTISDQKLRGASQRTSSHFYKGESESPSYAYLGAENMGLGQKFYVNYWIWLQWADDVSESVWNGGTGLQIKMLYVGDSFSGADLVRPALEPQWYWSAGPDTIMETEDDYTYINMKHGDENGALPSLCKPPNDTYPNTLVDGNGAWINVTYEVDQGTADTADGTFTNTQSIIDFESAYFNCSESGVKWRVSGIMDATEIGWLQVGPLFNDITNYYDDIYFDTGWSRVEIGDNADYDSCTHREIQPLTEHSTTSATITVNQGSFSDGAAYLFVIDDDGVMNTIGELITIGASTTPTINASFNCSIGTE